MENLIVNGIRNSSRNVDGMLQNAEGDDGDHEPVEEDDESNSDEYAGGNCGNKNDRKIRRRKILTSLDMNILTNR